MAERAVDMAKVDPDEVSERMAGFEDQLGKMSENDAPVSYTHLARGDAEKERARIVAAAHAEAEDIIAKAHDRADDEMKRSLASATDTIAKVSVAVAGKIVGDTLASDEAKQRELIKKYLAEVGTINGR